MHSEVALLSRPCIWNEALRIANEEGFRAFWKGNLVTIAHRLPYTAVNFYAYEQFKKVSFFYPYILVFCLISCYTAVIMSDDHQLLSLITCSC